MLTGLPGTFLEGAKVSSEQLFSPTLVKSRLSFIQSNTRPLSLTEVNAAQSIIGCCNQSRLSQIILRLFRSLVRLHDVDLVDMMFVDAAVWFSQNSRNDNWNEPIKKCFFRAWLYGLRNGFITELGVAITRLWMRWVAGAGVCLGWEQQDRKRHGE